jgi:DHA1 family bicyclomycin/chloramphenicol resistance-like MFS transporter
MQTPQHPPGRWLMVNLVAQIAFGLLAMTICLPSMQEWGQLLGTDQASVQLTFSAFVLTYGCLQLVYGPLSDRHGRKTVLLVGLAMALAGSVVGALSHSLGGLLVARVMQGAGAAAGAVVGRAAVQDLFHGPEKTRVMAFVGMAMGLCPPSLHLMGHADGPHGGALW